VIPVISEIFSYDNSSKYLSVKTAFCRGGKVWIASSSHFKAVSAFISEGTMPS
jgi:hypothetical protein